jgi:NAD(P)-dependent dehydrogenase (short-subunit alcohol dehydrogenase family)
VTEPGTGSGKVALVTGASRGIGRAVAHELACAGMRVAVHYGQRREAAEATLAALPGSGHRLFAADLARPDDAPALVERVVAELGGLDVLVNNAGIYELHPPTEVDEAAWRGVWERTLAVNLLSPAHLCFAAARHMMSQGGGRIVNISSRGAFRGEPHAPAYGASKAGLNALSQSLARALAPHGVYVFVVAPGWVETDMAEPHLTGAAGDEVRQQSPLGRAARPEEIARVVSFLAVDGTPQLTGCIVDANGASYLRS